MARITDKSADSTSGEVPSPKTDGLLDPIPEDLTKKNEQSLILPTPLADVETDPNRLSEVMDSATIDASSGAIPGDSPTTVEQEISGLLASGSNAHQSNTAMQVPLVPTTTKDGLPSANIDSSLVNTRNVAAEEAPDDAEETPGISIDGVVITTTNSSVGEDAPPLMNNSVQLSMNDGVLSEECAAGIACTSPQGPADLSGCTHRCWGCGGRVHSLIFCGMSLERLLCDNPLLIGHQLPNGHIMAEDSDNERRCICHSCITNLSAKPMPVATRIDTDSIEPTKKNGGGAMGKHPLGLSNGADITSHVSSRRSNRPKLPITRKSDTSSSDTSSGTESDDTGPTASGSSSRIPSRSYYYHAPFTMYSKCYGNRPDNSTHYETLILNAMDSRSIASNRSNRWKTTIDKWNQPSKSKVTLTTIDDDLHIGDNGLFAQSTFKDGLLDDEEYLKSLCPTNSILPRIIIPNDALPFLVERLCQAVLHLKSLQNTRQSLSILKKKGGKTTINVIQIPASECSLGLIDGAEFFQWTYGNHLAQVWYCPSIKKSPFLVEAIQSAIKMSPMAMQAFSFDRLKYDTQFLGYVTAQTEENIVIHLHIHSFVVFYSDNNNTTNVVCMMSSRIHIMHPMQERLLQLVQLLQFHQTAPTFDLLLTNKVIYSYSEGNVAKLKLQEFSLNAYQHISVLH
jgi:hypothetical protein